MPQGSRDAQDVLDEIRRVIIHLKEKDRALKREVESLKVVETGSDDDKISKAKLEIAKLIGENTTLQNELQITKENLSKLQKEQQKLIDDKAKLTQYCKGWKANSNTYQTNYDSAVQHIEHLKTVIEALKKDKETLSQQIIDSVSGRPQDSSSNAAGAASSNTAPVSPQSIYPQIQKSPVQAQVPQAPLVVDTPDQPQQQPGVFKRWFRTLVGGGDTGDDSAGAAVSAGGTDTHNSENPFLVDKDGGDKRAAGSKLINPFGHNNIGDSEIEAAAGGGDSNIKLWSDLDDEDIMKFANHLNLQYSTTKECSDELEKIFPRHTWQDLPYNNKKQLAAAIGVGGGGTDVQLYAKLRDYFSKKAGHLVKPNEVATGGADAGGAAAGGATSRANNAATLAAAPAAQAENYLIDDKGLRRSGRLNPALALQ